jgi:methionyl-tRNA formyltransferase
MRIVFMGTPEFAVPSLRALVAADHDVVLVLSQPDRPAGRGKRLASPAVALAARELGLELFQPASLRPSEAVARLRDACPDVIVVAAYGLILRREVLDLPPRGCLNVHASLLPRWRGASPISAAIAAGDARTGVCIMQMEVGLDTGPVLACRETAISATDDTPTLTERLSALGAELLVETLPAWIEGRIAPRVQDDALATHAPKVVRSDALIDWSRPAVELDRHVRAYRGWPDAYTTWRGQTLKILAARPLIGEPVGAAGTVTAARIDGRRLPVIATGSGALAIELLAHEGKRPTDGGSFLNGYSSILGDILG